MDQKKESNLLTKSKLEDFLPDTICTTLEMPTKESCSSQKLEKYVFEYDSTILIYYSTDDYVM